VIAIAQQGAVAGVRPRRGGQRYHMEGGEFV
jgi:hypothetical protein